MIISRTARGWLVLLAVALIAAGCARSPEAKKARHLERGDRYAEREQYRDAIIEYKNVLRIEQANAHAIRQLGLMHYKLGELAQAYPYLLKAQELKPDDVDVRLKLGTLYPFAGKADAARQEAEFVLERDPGNLEAFALLAQVATTPADVDAAIRRLEAMRAELGDKARYQLILGALLLRKQDAGGAERAFQKAVALDPKSVEAHSALGGLYLAKGQAAEAEREFKTAADLALSGSRARLKLVDFYVLSQRPDEARRLLIEMTEKAPDYLPGWRRLAQLALDERKYDESQRAIEALLKKSPSDLEGHFLLGRLHLAKRETTQAIQEFQQVLKLEPRYTPARYQLALAQLEAGNVQQAKADLKEAIASTPNFVQAVLALAELNIKTGAIQPAIDDLEKFVAAQPENVAGQILLGSAYLAKRDSVKATEVFRRVVTLAPKDPRGHYLVGASLRAQGKAEEARKEFEAALALSPGYVDPLGQLVSMALGARQFDAAVGLVTKRIAIVPKSGRLQHVLGMVHLARNDQKQAEAAFLKAIELEPDLSDSYVQLANLYGTSGRYDEALTKLNAALKANPKNLAALMLVGVISERKGDLKGAQKSYEAVLAENPRFAAAANNLAWLLSEHGGDKEKALELAQRAKELLPENPSVSDTLGWILYKRGVYQQAASLLRESAAKLPDNPVVQYHWGLAAAKVGDTAAARAALTAAIASPQSFPEKDEARKLLADLK